MTTIEHEVVHRGKGKLRSTSCRHCLRTLSSPSKARWRQHMRGCEACPERIRRHFALPRQPSPTPRPAEEASTHATSLALATENTAFAESPGIMSWLDKMDASTHDALDLAFANIFFSTGIPFRLADASAVGAFFKLVRPSWTPPSARVIAGRLLNTAHGAMVNDMGSLIMNAQRICILTDGWTNVSGQHLVNYVLSFPGTAFPPLLYTTCNTSAIRQTGVAIAAAIEDVVLAVGVHKVVGIVTDNAPNMQAAWSLLEAKYPAISCNGCAAHVFNLLIKDVCILPFYFDVLDKVRQVTHFVRSRAAVLNMFQQLQAFQASLDDKASCECLMYVGETRWYTQHGSAKRVLQNKEVLQQLAVSPVVTSMSGSALRAMNDFVAIVHDSGFWADLLEVERILAPTSVLIGLLESNEGTLADVYHAFIKIHDEWAGHDDLLELAHARWVFIHTGSMGMAYFLDPRTEAGRDMIDDDQVDTMHLLKAWAITCAYVDKEDVVAIEIDAYVAFITGLSDEAKLKLHKQSAQTFWATYGRRHFPTLARVAQSVLDIPTSQAASERMWSLYDFIHTKRRNRLSAEVSTKLVQLYANASLTDTNFNLLDILQGFDGDLE